MARDGGGQCAGPMHAAFDDCGLHLGHLGGLLHLPLRSLGDARLVERALQHEGERFANRGEAHPSLVGGVASHSQSRGSSSWFGQWASEEGARQRSHHARCQLGQRVAFSGAGVQCPVSCSNHQPLTCIEGRGSWEGTFIHTRQVLEQHNRRPPVPGSVVLLAPHCREGMEF